jgi:hypothetical protein
VKLNFRIRNKKLKYSIKKSGQKYSFSGDIGRWMTKGSYTRSKGFHAKTAGKIRRKVGLTDLGGLCLFAALRETQTGTVAKAAFARFPLLK